ncbi:TetR/AcrR family transcriptional regulator [Cohnella nanjingensis]|uniref:TetR/AcrR family transcriptional regulator n=1 Tax=Cohnella nanjingensis TaxID=1387779 RepID=A0A7X0VGC4_9BACL|nr:TetR/AcrR family transcriptional regulator [Cohnella nanjingensis]MBB6672716.1 TetR/AcrR family transcriptional regulator [Cohnella nanjingensis]
MLRENDEQLEPWMRELLAQEDGAPRMTEKQSRIIAAAVELFAEKGYSGSSTSEIAQRAGVAEGTIFRHYKTKKDLLFSIVTPAMVRIMAPFVLREFGDVLKTEYASYEQFLRAMIENRIAFLNKNRRLFKIIVQEFPFQPDLQEQFKKYVLSHVIERLKLVIDKFKADGLLIDLPSTTVIRLSVSAVMGYVLARTFIQDQSEWDDEAEREATIAFIMRGLTP